MKLKEFLLKEEKEKHAVLAFGRMNPPTTGHGVLVDKVKEIAKQHKATHHVVLSHSQDKAKNPLSPAQKLTHARRFFPGTNLSVSSKEHPTFLHHAAELHKKGVTHLHMVAGSDRVEEYKKKLAQYNGTHKDALYNFKHIEVHSAGERDPDAEGTEGMSASKMRKHAGAGNFDEFKKGIPAHVPEHHAKELYNHVRKGMSVKESVKLDLPLDDLFEQTLNEGVHDKSIFKAVFLAGGPGSGKDYVLSNTLDGHGLTEINSDKALEYLMDKKGLDKTMPASEKEVREVVRGKAKNMTELRQRLALLGRNGLIINGTGDDVEKIRKIKERLEEIGYETHMVAVNTADEVSKQRNIERGASGGRTVPENIRKQKWDAVQNARPEFAKMFGDNYTEFDNSEDLRKATPDVVKAKKDEMLEIFKKVKAFTSKHPSHPAADLWVAHEMSKKDTLGAPKDGADKSPNKESAAYQQAMKLGLKYFGFGRYGKDGVVTHHSVNDKLVASVKEDLDSQFDNFLTEAVTISVTADTPEEATKTMQLLTGDHDVPVQEPEDDQYEMSDMSARNLLTFGQSIGVIEPQVSAGSVNIMPRMNTEDKKPILMTGKDGKIRVFALRSAAAKEAHVNGGSVVKSEKGYVVKLKEDTNVEETIRLIQEETGTSTSTSSTSSTSGAGRTKGGTSTGITESCGSKDGGNNASSKPKIYLSQAKKSFKANIKEIDAGTEVGLSMASSGENLNRSTTSVRAKTAEGLASDDTGISTSAKKEDELSKQGISLTTFKSKTYI
jgi:dephospho-CoA kinase